MEDENKGNFYRFIDLDGRMLLIDIRGSHAYSSTVQKLSIGLESF